MNLNKLILTKNACYLAGRKMKPKGIMVHSTGANNPWLKRYIGPDDGKLGKNANGNHWNQYHPDGRSICCHAFIGKLKDGIVATYQTLPWDHRGWHCGGRGNDYLIGFEICEDGLKDKTYFTKVYNEAVDLCVYLCKKYNLTEKDIICHCEGYRKGIATNHGDVMHWFPKFGKSMDAFRADVKKKLNAKTVSATTNQIIDETAIERKAIDHFSQCKSWMSLNERMASFFVKNGPICKTMVVRNMLKRFEKNGQLLVRREPGVTEKGRLTKFMEETTKKKVSIRWVL